MRAGTGVTHSEYNPSPEDELRFLQIWILPAAGGGEPGYVQKAFPEAALTNRAALVASHDGREGSIPIGQDVSVYVSQLDAHASIAQGLDHDRHAWVQVTRGAVRINGAPLEKGDGAAVSGETTLRIEATAPSELLLFDLA